LGMVVTYAIAGFVVHHPVGSGGIGEFTLFLCVQYRFTCSHCM